MPPVSDVVTSLAALPATETIDRTESPSEKVTVPVAVPPNCGVIVAVNVMDWPEDEGLALVVKASVVFA